MPSEKKTKIQRERTQVNDGEGRTSANQLSYGKKHHQRKKKTIIAFMLTFLYIWDNRRIKYISTEENNNGYFRELKSFANIYFHFFSIQMLFYIYGCAFGCHLLATVK